MELRNISTRTVTLRDSLNTVYTVPAYGNLVVADGLWNDNEFRRWMRMRIRDVVVIPTSVQTNFASVDEPYITTAGTASLTNEKILGSAIIMRGTLAARPAPSIAGRLYFVTDTGQQRWTRDSGNAWEDTSVDFDAVLNKPSSFSPSAHAASHASNGSDPLISTLNANARVAVKKDGSVIGTRRGINFSAGNNVDITPTDDSTNEEVDVVISSGSAGMEILYGSQGSNINIASGGSILATATATFESVPHWIEFWCTRLDAPTQSLGGGGAAITVSLQVDGSNLWSIGINPAPDAPSTASNIGLYVPIKHTPSAGSHTYRMFASGGLGQAVMIAPAFIRATKVS